MLRLAESFSLTCDCPGRLSLAATGHTLQPKGVAEVEWLAGRFSWSTEYNICLSRNTDARDLDTFVVLSKT